MHYLVIFQFSAIHWLKLFNIPNVSTYLITYVCILNGQCLDGILESILSSLEHSVVSDCDQLRACFVLWIVCVWACVGSCHSCLCRQMHIYSMSLQ